MGRRAHQPGKIRVAIRTAPPVGLPNKIESRYASILNLQQKYIVHIDPILSAFLY
jgi:hypothetical protein